MAETDRLFDVDNGVTETLGLMRGFLTEELLGREVGEIINPHIFDGHTSETIDMMWRNGTLDELLAKVMTLKDEIVIDIEIAAETITSSLASQRPELLTYTGLIESGEIDFMEWLKTLEKEHIVDDVLEHVMTKEIINQADIDIFLKLAEDWAQAIIDDMLERVIKIELFKGAETMAG